MRRQQIIRGVQRRPMATSVIEKIEAAISSEMRRYDVSRAFVIANALAFTFGIDTEDYRTTRRKRRRRRP